MDRRPSDAAGDEPARDTVRPDDVVPDDAARGAPTIPGFTDTGTTTPPIAGWGETVRGEERAPEPPPEE